MKLYTKHTVTVLGVLAAAWLTGCDDTVKPEMPAVDSQVQALFSDGSTGAEFSTIYHQNTHTYVGSVKFSKSDTCEENGQVGAVSTDGSDAGGPKTWQVWSDTTVEQGLVIKSSTQNAVGPLTVAQEPTTTGGICATLKMLPYMMKVLGTDGENVTLGWDGPRAEAARKAGGWANIEKLGGDKSAYDSLVQRNFDNVYNSGVTFTCHVNSGAVDQMVANFANTDQMWKLSLKR